MPAQSTDAQLGPMLALVELRRTTRTLPPARWTLGESGYLTATVHDPDAFTAYHQVLGGRATRRHRFAVHGAARIAEHLTVIWQDIEMTVFGIYDAALVDTDTAGPVAA
jgi:hypothetical protein